jgi:hypothetical protein
VQTIKSLKGFVTSGDTSGQYGGGNALTSPVSAALAVVGLLLAMRRFREPESRLVLLWAGLGLLLGSILIIDPPSHTRLIVLFPVPFIFAALTIETASRWIEGRGWRWARLAVRVAILLIIAQAAVFNLDGYHRYVTRVQKEGRVWDVIKVVERFGKKHDYYFFGGPTMSASAPGLRLFAGRHRIVSGITPTDIPHVLARDTVFIVPYLLPQLEPQMRNVGTVITERFPDSEREIVGAKYNPQLILYVAKNGGAEPPSGGRGVRNRK